MRPLLLTFLLVAPAAAQWGKDLDAGAARQMIATVQEELAAIVAAPPAERGALIEAFVGRHGAERIEAIKRFRDPELKELFVRLLAHDDWHVQHRALLALEYYGDATLIDRVWPFLEHPHRRMREKAAITLIKLWDRRKAPPEWPRILEGEVDPHVHECLLALDRRMAGTLPVERVQEEQLVKAGGVLLTPYLDGMHRLAEVAPGVKLKPDARAGKGGAPPATRWTTPLLGWGEEEVPGVSLQPFANPREGGRVHTGYDVGAHLEGAGFYACAEGAVRLVHTGSDMGTLIVVEHQLSRRETVNAVYMHGGDTVFVEPGERVTPGQLLGTMGLGFSIENGGHFAHLHFGLYPGPFSMTHNYGYKLASQGLADWYDPARVLPLWMDRTAPLLPRLRPLHASLRAALKEADRGEFGKAHAQALRARDGAEPGSEAHADAVYLLGLLEAVPAKGIERARRVRDAGYPADALKALEALAARCKGMPGAATAAEEIAAWEADDSFNRALKGEARLESTAKRAEKQKDPMKARDLWNKLLAEYGDTCLKPRIEEHLK